MDISQNTRTARTAFLYGGYAVVAVLVSLYLFFPEERLAQAINQQGGRIHPEIAFQTEAVSLDFPFRLRLKGAAWTYRGVPILRSARVRLSPVVLSLLKKKRPSVSSQTTALPAPSDWRMAPCPLIAGWMVCPCPISAAMVSERILFAARSAAV